ncbi:hypothetical protein GQ53DRAFT_754016 [Thozetella sp. PMI_491]|nr:hypothetical protein GQ53DRAFT_754016 [Thozetella sp. PMI_491]
MVQLQIEDKEPVDFAKEVVEILNSVLTPDGKSPEDAAADLNALYPSHRANGDKDSQKSGESFLWWFWDLYHDLARQVPHDSPEQEKFVAVIKSLHDLPSEVIELDNWGVLQLWSDLPLLSPTLREKWDDDPRPPEGADRKQRFLNLQTYAARIAGLGLCHFEAFAIWALTDALEGEMTPIRGAPDEINLDPTAVGDLPFKVSLAAAWIAHAGSVLYGRDEEIRGTQGGPLWRLPKKEAMRQGRKYRGTQGLCPERWELWKSRFGVIRDNKDVDEDTRKTAQGALDAMERAEMGN